MSRQNYKVSGLELFTGTSIVFGDGSVQTTAAFGSSSSTGVTSWDQILHKNDLQGPVSIAIGQNAGTSNQGTNAVAIGPNAGQTDQGEYSIAIGNNAGQTTQSSYSIVLNAGVYPLEATEHGFYVSPIRYSTETEFALFYDGITKEIIQTTPSIRAVPAPLTLTSPGKMGDVAFDQDYIYHCFSTYVPGQSHPVTTLEGYKAAHGGEPAEWQNQTSTYALSVLQDAEWGDVQPLQWIGNGLTMTQVASVTTESSIAGIINHCVLSTLTGVVNFSTETELLVYTMLEQTSSWKRTPWNAITNPGYVNPPIQLSGASGDTAGQVAFSTTSMYYCVQTYNPLTAPPTAELFITLNSGTTNTSTIGVNMNQSPNWNIPQPGWAVDIDGVSYILTDRSYEVTTSSGTATVYRFVFDDIDSNPASFTVPSFIRLYDLNSVAPEIWKTIPYSQNLQDIVPSVTNFYNLGSTAKRWKTVYANTLTVTKNIVFADSSVQVTAFTGIPSTLSYSTGTDFKIVTEYIGSPSNVISTWTFGAGVLTFPDETIQSTAYQIVSPPDSSTSTGVAGNVAYNESYFYACTATNAWQRVAWDSTPW